MVACFECLCAKIRLMHWFGVLLVLVLSCIDYECCLVCNHFLPQLRLEHIEEILFQRIYIGPKHKSTFSIFFPNYF